MNDFTKDELEDLLSWGEIYTEFGRSWTDKFQRPLINKIKSMIDNYCEHVFILTLNDSSVHCHKCGKNLNE